MSRRILAQMPQQPVEKGGLTFPEVPIPQLAVHVLPDLPPHAVLGTEQGNGHQVAEPPDQCAFVQEEASQLRPVRPAFDEVEQRVSRQRVRGVEVLDVCQKPLRWLRYRLGLQGQLGCLEGLPGLLQPVPDLDQQRMELVDATIRLGCAEG